MLLVVGDQDSKFMDINTHILKVLTAAPAASLEPAAKPVVEQLQQSGHAMVVLQDCGHAAHVEQPHALIAAVSEYLKLV